MSIRGAPASHFRAGSSLASPQSHLETQTGPQHLREAAGARGELPGGAACSGNPSNPRGAQAEDSSTAQLCPVPRTWHWGAHAPLQPHAMPDGHQWAGKKQPPGQGKPPAHPVHGPAAPGEVPGSRTGPCPDLLRGARGRQQPPQCSRSSAPGTVPCRRLLPCRPPAVRGLILRIISRFL